jgi:pimeloyl-ACP methyl ester carboxylesterase
MERVQLNGADIEYDVRGSGAPVVFIHGAILSDGFVPVIEQAGIAENFQIVHYRRRGYARSSRAVAGMKMQGWAGDCIALLNHLGIASAHVAGHSFGAGIALQMAIDAPGRVRKLALLEPPLGSLVPSGAQFTEWVASVREIYDSGDKTAATDIALAGVYGQDYRRFHRRRPACGCVRPRGIRYRHVLSGRTRSHATLEYLNRRPERYSTPGAVDARQQYIAGIL